MEEVVYRLGMILFVDWVVIGREFCDYVCGLLLELEWS